jgi:checkpoint serine/threonine-protein kinase
MAYRAFEDEIIAKSGTADPLEPWIRYVRWAKQEYITMTPSESPLIHVLERATQAFSHDDRYANDPRYVKLWIAYVRAHPIVAAFLFAFRAVFVRCNSCHVDRLTS